MWLRLSWATLADSDDLTLLGNRHDSGEEEFWSGLKCRHCSCSLVVLLYSYFISRFHVCAEVPDWLWCADPGQGWWWPCHRPLDFDRLSHLTWVEILIFDSTLLVRKLSFFTVFFLPILAVTFGSWAPKNVRMDGVMTPPLPDPDTCLYTMPMSVYNA